MTIFHISQQWTFVFTPIELTKKTREVLIGKLWDQTTKMNVLNEAGWKDAAQVPLQAYQKYLGQGGVAK